MAFETIKHWLGLDEDQEEVLTVSCNGRTPVQNRINIARRELHDIIKYLTNVHNKLLEPEITDAREVTVVSREAIDAADHAILLAEIVKGAYTIDKRLDDFRRAIKNASEQGYYGNGVYIYSICMGRVDRGFYSSFDEDRRNLLNYYINLLNTVYLCAAIKIMEKKNYTFRVCRSSYEMCIFSNENAPESIRINKVYANTYSKSEPIGELMNEYLENAKDLSAKFPELISPEIRNLIGLGAS